MLVDVRETQSKFISSIEFRQFPKSLVARNSVFLGRNVLRKDNSCVYASATDHCYGGGTN